ncbi:MAG: ATP-dependent RNA helicase DbpA [Epsilonproteobacteria bacterium]|nr:MAG: ATP-dependent RNA helicase DbpA [Campylobacterota bacterium]
MDTTDFSKLDLSEAMLQNLDSLGYTTMTPIQAQSLPPILHNRDVIAKAKTGSGKTAAFGIGMLMKLNVKRFRIQEIVLCPTRELADQVAMELRRLARFKHNIKILTLCGGMPFGPQRGSLEHGAHIIVGTPGRIQDHLGKGTLVLDDVHTLVLDEADRMLDMGFSESILKIISNIPKERQTLLFSATYPDEIAKMSRSVQKDAVTVSIEAVHSENTITQRFYKVSRDNKVDILEQLLNMHQPESTVIFCNTKIACDDLADDLADRHFHAFALHGDLDQKERTEVLTLFSNGSTSVLVATDVAARGLDIKDLKAVVNYDLPHDPEIYVHRIGRTGRAGKEGLALSLYSSKEASKVNAIESYTKTSVEYGDINSLPAAKGNGLQPRYSTLAIDGGKKSKLRPGDILGALTGDAGIEGKYIGKINVFDMVTYVAVDRSVVKSAFVRLRNGKIKGRNFRVRKVD